MTPTEARETIVTLLRAAVPELTSIYLYGSRAHAAAHALPSSDYDIAFHAAGHESLTGLARFSLANELATALRVDFVDLVDLRGHISHVLRMNIIDGELLWAADAGDAVGREAKWATMAADFRFGETDLREAQIAELRGRVGD